MSQTTTTQIVREDPAIEAYRLGLLESAKELADKPVSLPQYQVSGLSGLQQLAAEQAQAGVGSFIPFIQAGSGAIGAGQTQIQQGAMPALVAATRTMEGAQPLLSQAANLADLTRALPYQYQQMAAQGLDTAMRTAGEPTQLGVAELQNLARLGAQTGGTAAGNIQEAVAGLPPQLDRATQGGLAAQQLAAQQAQQAIGAARGTVGAAAQDLASAGRFGRGTAAAGIASLRGTGGEFDPSRIQGFMSPFEEQAVQQALADIRREGEIAQQNVAAQGVQAGAFGGSRQAVAEQELQRNVMEQQARTAGQMRAQGFESAAQRAQQAYEQAMGRQQQAAGMTGQLGQAGAGTALQAAQAAGQLGLSAEQLAAQTGLQTGQLGLSAQQQAASNALAQAQQLAAAQQAAGQMGLAGQAQAGQQFGQAAQLGQGLGQMGLQQAQQLGQLGLQFGQLGQQDIATLGQLAQQQAALGQGLGGLAGQAGQLGAQLGTLGLQQASLGELQSKLGQSDIDTLMGVGGMQYQQAQAALEAKRQSELQKAYEPYQRVSFLSDIYAKTPSAQQTLSVGTSPAVSPFQQIAGLGIAGLSAASGAKGLFG